MKVGDNQPDVGETKSQQANNSGQLLGEQEEG